MKRILLATLPTLLLSACAGLGGASPEEIARLPIVVYGQPAPANTEFVLHYPAGADLPVIAKITGDLFAKTDETTLKVRLKQDIYRYRNQVSFDGKTWAAGTDKVGGNFWFTLPGEKAGKPDTQSPGELAAEFKLR